jgi:hypothetical protein
LGTGYNRVIKAETKWDYVRTLENGGVSNTLVDQAMGEKEIQDCRNTGK